MINSTIPTGAIEHPLLNPIEIAPRNPIKEIALKALFHLSGLILSATGIFVTIENLHNQGLNYKLSLGMSLTILGFCNIFYSIKSIALR